MVHTFSGLGLNVALDVESGAVHVLDELGMAVLRHVRVPMPEDCPPDVLGGLTKDYEESEVRAAWAELYTLAEQGQLFADKAVVAPPEGGPLKALCLHVSHDCDLRCGYCFAGTGHYGGDRQTMSFEVARAAIDMLVRRSGVRRNLEIDFFGGEPLLALDTVKQTVAYARAHEAAWGKHFRFTLTTNGLGLDEQSIRYLNEEMDNVVLSLDGREATNDTLRKTAAGEGSYRQILPKLRALVKDRDRDYYVRGTFTAKNPDFVDDLLHLADLGFEHLSMEPVVLPDGHPLALREEHLPTIFGAYDRLLTVMSARDDFTFFHYTVDLTQGPCIYKRLRGCGAGFEYAAISPEGDIYPCHQFVGKPDYKMGTVHSGVMDTDMADRFAAMTVDTKPECADCWAKYYCSGGCAAAGENICGTPDKPYELGCRLQRKRLECAILLQIARLTASD